MPQVTAAIKPLPDGETENGLLKNGTIQFVQDPERDVLIKVLVIIGLMRKSSKTINLIFRFYRNLISCGLSKQLLIFKNLQKNAMDLFLCKDITSYQKYCFC